MRPDEPLELLQVARVADQDVLGDRIEFLCLVDGVANVFDDTVVDEVQRRQVCLGRVTADRIVVPIAILDDRPRGALG